MNAATLALLLICGHELPDGVISCGMQAVVRDDRIELRYQIGISPDTARETLRKWGFQGAEASAQPAQPGPEPPSEPPSAPPVFPVFRDVALQRCRLGISIEIDGRLQPPPRAVSVKEVRRAHARVECLYEFDNPAGDGRSHEILIRDDNFPHAPGVREVAVKGRGGFEIRTSAPPVLGRASDHDATSNDKQTGPRQLRFRVGADGAPTPSAIWPWLLAAGLLIAVAGTAARYGGHNSDGSRANQQ